MWVRCIKVTNHDPKVQLSHQLDLSWIGLLGCARVVNRLSFVIEHLHLDLPVRGIILLNIESLRGGPGFVSIPNDLIVLCRHGEKVGSRSRIPRKGRKKD